MPWHDEEWESWPEEELTEDDGFDDADDEEEGDDDGAPDDAGDDGRIEGGCRVRFEPSGRSIVVEPGTALIDAARAAGLPVAQSCGGWGICSWCKMQVLDGLEHLSPAEPVEARLIIRQAFAANERASCQAEVFGPVTVTTTYW